MTDVKEKKATLKREGFWEKTPNQQQTQDYKLVAKLAEIHAYVRQISGIQWMEYAIVNKQYPIHTDIVVSNYSGSHKCLLCNIRHGFDEMYVANSWLFPRSLLHYVKNHNVWTSPEFRSFILDLDIKGLVLPPTNLSQHAQMIKSEEAKQMKQQIAKLTSYTGLYEGLELELDQDDVQWLKPFSPVRSVSSSIGVHDSKGFTAQKIKQFYNSITVTTEQGKRVKIFRTGKFITPDIAVADSILAFLKHYYPKCHKIRDIKVFNF